VGRFGDDITGFNSLIPHKNSFLIDGFSIQLNLQTPKAAFFLIPVYKSSNRNAVAIERIILKA
jgi:hypothetical protein